MAEAQKKTKRPTADKRTIQSEKRRMRNRVFKSRVRTAIRALQTAVAQKNGEQSTTCLNAVYSLMDKGVKIGVYKKNKAARSKRSFSVLVASAS